MRTCVKATVALVETRMPHPGDRSPGSFVEPSRCWAMVFDKPSVHSLPGATQPHGPMAQSEAVGTWWRFFDL